MAGHQARLERIVADLRSRGERMTPARRAVLEALLDAHGGHLTVDELAHRVQGDHPDIHLSTVYRTLGFLEGAGVVTEVHLGPSTSAYHFADEHHHHAVCTRCGRVLELPDDAFADLERRLRDDTGFVAQPHHVTIDGLCKRCWRPVDGSARMADDSSP